MSQGAAFHCSLYCTAKMLGVQVWSRTFTLSVTFAHLHRQQAVHEGDPSIQIYINFNSDFQLMSGTAKGAGYTYHIIAVTFIKTY